MLYFIMGSTLNTVGFPCLSTEDHKNREERIALLPRDISSTIIHPEQLCVEEGYGTHLDITDEEYAQTGARIVSRDEALSQNILCKPKLTYIELQNIRQHQTAFGWAYMSALYNNFFRKFKMEQATMIEWSGLQHPDGNLVLQRNNAMAGEIGVEHALRSAEISPAGKKIAVIGRGNVGTAALTKLRELGATDIDIFHSENIDDLKSTLAAYDIIVHGAAANPFILEIDDIREMKQDSFFIYLGSACVSQFLETTPKNPIGQHSWYDNHVRHYRIPNVPSLDPLRASGYISEDLTPFLNQLIRRKFSKTLKGAIEINKGIECIRV